MPGTGTTDCERLQDYLDAIDACNIEDIVCEFIEFCGGDFDDDGDVDCDDLDDLIDCIEDNEGCALSPAQIDAIAACLGCTPGSGCQTIGGSDTQFFRGGSTFRCDQDCDGDVDCDDLAAFVARSRDCNGGSLTRGEVLEIVCEYVKACEPGNGVCDWLIQCLNDIMQLEVGDDAAPLNDDEIDDFRDAQGCANCSFDDPPEQKCTEEHDTEGECGTCGTLNCSLPRDGNSVELGSGDQMIFANDLTVRSTGLDFSLDRASRDTSACDEYVGNNWTLSATKWMYHDDTNGTIGIYGWGGGTPMIRGFTNGAGPWNFPGPTDRSLSKASVTINTTSHDVWRVEEPGGWQIDFYRGPTATELDGLILQTRDPFGNIQTYEYISLGTTNQRARLRTIYLNGEDEDDTNNEGEIHFDWILDSGNANYGKLRSVRVVRNGVMTQKVEYTYFEDGANYHADLGTAGDLVQVTKFTHIDRMVGASSLEPFRIEITQYRYHAGAGASSGVAARGYTWDGSSQQIKMVIQPEQVEYYAQKDNAGAQTPVLPTSSAETLMTLADGTAAFTEGGDDVLVVDLASTVNEEYHATTKKVETLYIQSACGCGGSATQGKKVTYEYFSYSGGDKKTTKVTEYTKPVSTWVEHRSLYFDLEKQGPDPDPNPDHRLHYVVTTATVDGSDEWVTHFDYDQTYRDLLFQYTTAAISSYDPGTISVAPIIAINTSSGLVHGYTYDTKNNSHLVGRYLKDGYNSASETIGDFIQIEKIDYGDAGVGWDATNSRDHLVSQRIRYRDESGSGDDNEEKTKYFYGFHGGAGDDIAWIETEVESELAAENGPGGSYITYQLLDTEAKSIWSRAADGSLTKYTHDADTAAVTQIVRNHDGTGLPSGTDYSGMQVAITTWTSKDRNADGGTLTTDYTLDLLGRVQEVVAPNGTSSYTMREMREWTERDGLLFYATVSLRHTWTEASVDKYAGPVTVNFQNASGGTIGRSQYTIGANGYGAPIGSGYTMPVSSWDQGTELSRSATVHTPSGLVSDRKVWHSLAGNGEGSGVYTTTFVYDELGRVDYTVSATGTVTRNTYDVLDRVIKTEIGILDGNGDPTDMTTISETFYDSPQTATQGVGNGNVTFTRQHVDDTTTRDTKLYYDFRDRRIKTVNPLAPHDFVVYDNLNRVTERALFDAVPTGIATPLANRKSYSKTFFSQRGLTYLTQTAIEPDNSLTDFIESHSWYDEAGRSVGSWSPSGPGQKTTYDGLSRAITSYVTDRGGDGVGSSSHAQVYDSTNHTAKVNGDVVFQESHINYIENGDYTNDEYTGLVDLVTSHLRTHAAADTDTGDLATMTGDANDDVNVITTYASTYVDKGMRRIRSANYGTNRTDGWSHSPSTSNDKPTITQGSEPDWDTTGAEIVSHTDYNDRGLVDYSTDPKGFKTKIIYDDMNRQIAVIENWENADLDSTTPWDSTNERWNFENFIQADQDNARDRITSFVFNGSGATIKQIAHLFDGSTEKHEETKYDYGVSKGAGGTDSKIASEDLLFKAHFPDETTGDASTATAYTVTYTYDRLGEVLTMTDQNQVKHSYRYNDRGQVTVDKPTFPSTGPGSDLDQTINGIVTTYDSIGRRSKVTSYSDYGGGGQAIENEAEFIYNDDDLGALTDVKQQHDGAVDGSSPKVTYTYLTKKRADGNYQRVTKVTYPSGLAPESKYGGGSTSDDTISRLKTMEWTEGLATNQIVAYDYIGLSMPAVVDYSFTSVDVQLDYQAAHNGARNDGEYPGYDRFGRIVKQHWVDGNFTTHATDNTVPNIPPLVELDYEYDKVGNRTKILDGRPGAGQSNRDLVATMDDLHRLQEFKRGVDGGNFFGGNQRWSLDHLGNWVKLETDGTGDGDYLDANEVENRDHNLANELTGRDIDDDQTNELTYTFDDVGNLRTSNDGTTTTTYTHDGWSRLVKVVVGTDPRTENSYNGLNWRVSKRSDTDLDGALDQERIMFYNAGWQLVEEDIYEGWTSQSPGVVDERRAYLWGARYIDDAIAMLVDGDADGVYDHTNANDAFHFFLTDAQFSVIGVLDTSGGLEEWVAYDAYGEARHHDWRDVDGDGDYDATDHSTIQTISVSLNNGIGQMDYRPEADMDRDGDVDSTDLTLAGTNYPTALSKGELSYPAIGNIIGYDGYLFNAETEQYTVRNRHYDTILGRWLERDPAGYVDGMNAFLYAHDAPILYLDKAGTDDDLPPGYSANADDLSYQSDKIVGDDEFSCCSKGSLTADPMTLKATIYVLDLDDGSSPSSLSVVNNIFNQCCVRFDKNETTFSSAEIIELLGQDKMMRVSNVAYVFGNIRLSQDERRIKNYVSRYAGGIGGVYRGAFHIKWYYVRQFTNSASGATGFIMGTAYTRWAYGPSFIQPAFATKRTSTQRTEAHELGHVTLNTVRHTSGQNLMTQSNSSTSIKLTAKQCRTIRKRLGT